MNRSISSPLLSGVTAAIIAFLINLAIPVVPAIAARTAADHTTISVLDAITTAVDFSALGHLGSIELTVPGMSGPVTLTPLGLTLVFGLVCTVVMTRRTGALHITARDGSLLPGAIPALGALVGGFTVTYGLLTGLIGLLANTTYVHVNTAPTAAGATLIAVLSAGLGIMLALRRPAHGQVPAVGVLALIPAPADAIIRALAGAFAALLAGAAIVFTILLLTAGPDVIAITGELQPGIVGGTVLIIAQLLLLPTLMVWTLAVLLGGTVAVGVGTGISLGGSQTGVMPAVPVLAALPGPGEFHAAWWLLLLLPVASAALGAVVLGRETRGERGRRALALWAGYAVLLTICLLILCSIATGQIGSDQLAELGPRTGGLVLPVFGISVLGTGLGALWFHTPLRDMVGERTAALRERISSAERKAAAEKPGAPEGKDASAAEQESADREQALKRLAEQKRAANAPPRVRTASERRDAEPERRSAQSGRRGGESERRDAESGRRHVDSGRRESESRRADRAGTGSTPLSSRSPGLSSVKRPRAIRPPAKGRGRYRADRKHDR